MSNDGKEPIYWADSQDPDMQHAGEQARATFRYLWRELSWERRRIIPALSLACVKTPFADAPLEQCGPDDPVEQMWVSDIEFDGRTITGTLLNSPNWLQSVKEGDRCAFPIEQLTDWMYAIAGRVYGAHTVQLMRSRMNSAERRAHDDAWSLDFGDPAEIVLVPPAEVASKQGRQQRSGDPGEEHPMSVNAGQSFDQHLRQHPGIINQPDERGWTLLHFESLAGNAVMVEMLLQHGADRSLRTRDGDAAIDLAKLMRWDKIVALLSN